MASPLHISEAEAAKDFSALLDCVEAGEVVFIERPNGRILKIFASPAPAEPSGEHRNIVDALSKPGIADIDFDPPRLRDLARPADFS